VRICENGPTTLWDYKLIKHLSGYRDILYVALKNDATDPIFIEHGKAFIIHH
jgi:hypothetical protein